MDINNIDEVADVQIFVTKNYNKFKFYENNRSLLSLSKLESMIKASNKLKFHPITVSDDFVIIDGQHRFAVCRKNHWPVYYIIDDDFQPIDIPNINYVQNAWTTSNFINFYAKTEPDYLFLKTELERSKINLTAFVNLFTHRSYKNSNIAIKSKSLKFKYSYNDIKKFVSKFIDIKEAIFDIFPDTKRKRLNTAFQYSLGKLCILDLFDEKLFIQKINAYPEDMQRILKFNDLIEIRRRILDLYNKKNSKNRLELD